MINQQNRITKLRIEIPTALNTILEVDEEIARLKYQIECFENPLHLMQLAELSEYSHLKYPLKKEIITISIPQMEQLLPQMSSQEIQIPPKLSLATMLFQEGLGNKE
jgi:predicted methyltransferase